MAMLVSLSMSEISRGDVVQLKSGGPRMTVTDIANDDGGTLTAWTVWFEGSRQITGTFPIFALTKA
jgi:uncharacterized protein YodC (DUF2158 family)